MQPKHPRTGTNAKPGSRVQLIPYIEINGIRTFKDTDVMGFYDRMEKDKTAPVVFHDGQIRDAKGFLRFMRSPGVALYVVYADNELAGLLWLTDAKPKTCMVHFVAFSEFWQNNSVEIGRTSIARIMEMKDKSGAYLFDVLQGLLPSWNTRAIKWLKAIGLEVVGEIPKVLWDAQRNSSVDGTLLYLTRELLTEG